MGRREVKIISSAGKYSRKMTPHNPLPDTRPIKMHALPEKTTTPFHATDLQNEEEKESEVPRDEKNSTSGISRIHLEH